MKKEYISPEFYFVGVLIDDVLSGSVENYSSYVDDGGDWGDDPIFDEDENIDW